MLFVVILTNIEYHKFLSYIRIIKKSVKPPSTLSILILIKLIFARGRRGLLKLNKV
jgi:hypothetical protein